MVEGGAWLGLVYQLKKGSNEVYVRLENGQILSFMSSFLRCALRFVLKKSLGVGE